MLPRGADGAVHPDADLIPLAKSGLGGYLGQSEPLINTIGRLFDAPHFDAAHAYQVLDDEFLNVLNLEDRDDAYALNIEDAICRSGIFAEEDAECQIQAKALRPRLILSSGRGSVDLGLGILGHSALVVQLERALAVSIYLPNLKMILDRMEQLPAFAGSVPVLTRAGGTITAEIGLSDDYVAGEFDLVTLRVFAAHLDVAGAMDGKRFELSQEPFDYPAGARHADLKVVLRPDGSLHGKSEVKPGKIAIALQLLHDIFPEIGTNEAAALEGDLTMNLPEFSTRFEVTSRDDFLVILPETSSPFEVTFNNQSLLSLSLTNPFDNGSQASWVTVTHTDDLWQLIPNYGFGFSAILNGEEFASQFESIPPWMSFESLEVGVFGASEPSVTLQPQYDQLGMREGHLDIRSDGGETLRVNQGQCLRANDAMSPDGASFSDHYTVGTCRP